MSHANQKPDGQASPVTVSAVVVTFNSKNDIVKCLDSLIDQTFPLSEIIVIDNASTDGTADLITEKFQNVVLEALHYNSGFACGNNLGISKTSADWILTLNPDAYVALNFVEILLSFVAGNDRIGMAGGKLCGISEKGKSDIIDSMGIEIFQSRRVRDRMVGEKDNEEFAKPVKVFGVCAAAALYRRKMLDDTMLEGRIFPENFFSYYEDADLAWRAWRRNWESWIVPEAVGWHKRGGSPVSSKFSRILTHRNRLWLIARNERLTRLLGSFHYIILHELLMFLRVLRYPYLIKASLQSARGLLRSVRERKMLSDLNPRRPPFIKGIGFGKTK